MCVMLAVAVGIAQRAEEAGMVEQRMQFLAGALAAVMQIQHRAIHAFADQELLERRLVLQIALGLAALDLVERRLGDIEVAGIDQRAHLAEEESSPQGDRKSVVWGKSVSVRVDLGGRRSITKKRMKGMRAIIKDKDINV